MKPLLAIGLGNPLMGDDGVGCAVAERLAGDGRLPECAEVICGGSDLLRYAGQMEGRRRVVIIDAVQGDSEPGNVEIFEGAGSLLDERQDQVHHLSAVQAIRLLEMTSPVHCTLLGISVSSIVPGTGLSPLLKARLPAILDRVVQELNRQPLNHRRSA